ncbi:hypothetical protein BDV12DRAFT_192800 [Aspergillus spectabilis]
MVLETDRLPDIVQEFVSYSDMLKDAVQKATLELLKDIRVMLYDSEIGRWLGIGNMSRQSEYHAPLQDLRADKACEFFVKDPALLTWYRASDSQHLVILGDMGYGKTVGMSFLVDEFRRREKCQLPQLKVCYCFCRDDETGKGTYMFSALVLSLLEVLPGLKRPFFEGDKQTRASGIFDPATDFKKLAEFLQRLLNAIDRPVFIVVDGLDECDGTSRHGLIEFLKSLSRKTSATVKTIHAGVPPSIPEQQQ